MTVEGGVSSSTREHSIVVGAIALGALLVRLPHLMDIPVFWDEGIDTLWALDIARGARFPLTGLDSYYGPLFSYLVAGALRLFGESPLAPRILAAVAGALAVIPTCVLGRRLWSRRAGLIAGGLVAMSPVLVVNIGHYGWSGALSPLLVMSSLAYAASFAAGRSAWPLFACGLALGLAVQAHPTSSVVGPGIIVWLSFTAGGRRELAKALALVAGGFAIGYLPMLLAGFVWGPPLLQDAVQKRYAFAPTWSVAEYVSRLLLLARSLASQSLGRMPGEPASFHVYKGGLALLMLAGVWLARRRWLASAAVISAALLMPLVVSYYPARYLAPLLPPLFVLAGIACDAGLQQAERVGRQTSWHRAAPMAARIALAVVLVFPVAAIAAYYKGSAERQETNREYFHLVSTIRASGACGKGLTVALDMPDQSTIEGRQSWLQLQTMHYLLTMDHCEHRADPWRNQQPPAAAAWVVAAPMDERPLPGRLVAISTVSIPSPWETPRTWAPMTLYSTHGP